MSQKFYWGELNVVKRLNNFHSLHKTPRDIKDCETFIFLPVSCSIVEHKRWFIASGRQILLTYWGQNLHSGQQKVQTVHRNPSLDIWQCFFQEILTLNVPRCSRIGGILIHRSLKDHPSLLRMLQYDFKCFYCWVFLCWLFFFPSPHWYSRELLPLLPRLLSRMALQQTWLMLLPSFFISSSPSSPASSSVVTKKRKDI